MPAAQIMQLHRPAPSLLCSCSEVDTLQVLACVLLADLGKAADGLRCGELAAFCVHPSYRGSGRGDSLLDYVEQSENGHAWHAVKHLLGQECGTTSVPCTLHVASALALIKMVP